MQMAGWVRTKTFVATQIRQIETVFRSNSQSAMDWGAGRRCHPATGRSSCLGTAFRVALVAFGSSSSVVFEFDADRSLNDTVAAVLGTPKPGGGTRTAAALNDAYRLFTSLANLGRYRVREPPAALAMLHPIHRDLCTASGRGLAQSLSLSLSFGGFCSSPPL